MTTSRLHYVKVPENHIVIDFDIQDKDGNKSYDQGIHLHYIYAGTVVTIQTDEEDQDDYEQTEIYRGLNTDFTLKLPPICGVCGIAEKPL